MVREAIESGRGINCCRGRRGRTVVYLKSGDIILSPREIREIRARGMLCILFLTIRRAWVIIEVR